MASEARTASIRACISNLLENAGTANLTGFARRFFRRSAGRLPLRHHIRVSERAAGCLRAPLAGSLPGARRLDFCSGNAHSGAIGMRTALVQQRLQREWEL